MLAAAGSRVPDSTVVTAKDWAPLFDTPITARTAGDWLFGLGYNEGAPNDVLIGLLDYDRPCSLSRE